MNSTIQETTALTAAKRAIAENVALTAQQAVILKAWIAAAERVEAAAWRVFNKLNADWVGWAQSSSVCDLGDALWDASYGSFAEIVDGFSLYDGSLDVDVP